MMMITADCHTHSNTSPDGKNTIAEMCASAMEKGLKQICFCNHYEIKAGTKTIQDYLLDFDAYDEEIKRARDKFDDRLEILKGVEFGQPHQHPKEYEMILNQDFDMVAVSLHVIPIAFDVYWPWCGGMEAMLKDRRDYILETYFNELTAISAVGGYQMLAHCDWIRRSYPVEKLLEYDLATIMKNVLKGGARIEINTSGIRQGFGQTHPCKEILEIYQKVGGKEVTIGSDAHSVNDLAAFFSDAKKITEDLGLTVGYYKNRGFFPL